MDEKKERNGEERGITKRMDEREERGATWNTRRREDE